MITRRNLLLGVLLTLSGCIGGKSEEQRAREAAAGFWNENSGEFEEAQSNLEEARQLYRSESFSEAQQMALEAEFKYTALAGEASDRRDSADSEYERELFGLIYEIANNGAVAANHLKDVSTGHSTWIEDTNTGQERIQMHENKFEEHINRQNRAVDELLSELES